MGYETSFKLKGELDRKFKTWMKNETSKNDLEMYKTILVSKCMAEGNENQDNWYKFYKEISFAFRMYARSIEENWKLNIQKRLEGEDYEKYGIWFCGWNHARGSQASTWESMEDIENFFIPRLFSIAVCSAGSMFDSENDKYWNKAEKLDDYLNDLEDIVWECWDNQFIEFYRDHPELATEDGDDTPEPDDDGSDKVNDDYDESTISVEA